MSVLSAKAHLVVLPGVSCCTHTVVSFFALAQGVLGRALVVLEMDPLAANLSQVRGVL